MPPLAALQITSCNIDILFINFVCENYLMSIYTTFSDNELIALLKQEDHPAFTELYNRYWRKLFVISF